MKAKAEICQVAAGQDLREFTTNAQADELRRRQQLSSATDRALKDTTNMIQNTIGSATQQTAQGTGISSDIACYCLTKLQLRVPRLIVQASFRTDKLAVCAHMSEHDQWLCRHQHYSILSSSIASAVDTTANSNTCHATTRVLGCSCLQLHCLASKHLPSFCITTARDSTPSATSSFTGLESMSAKQQSLLEHLHSISNRDQASLQQVQQTSSRGQAHVQGWKPLLLGIRCEA